VSSQTPTPPSLELRRPFILLTAFFLSGAASLIFEVVWTRILLITLGATATAMGAVLGAFMGGMAIGCGLAAKGFISRRNPVMTFALLEGWAGVYGLATPHLLRLVGSTSPTLEFVLALLILLPSTIAMGASLPVLSRALGRSSQWPASEVGRLYAANTAGAVTGPLIAVFWLFPAFGLSRTLLVASAADLLISVALLAGRKHFALEGIREVTGEARTDRPKRLLLAAMAASGASAMVYEVAWTRTLSLVYGSSVYGTSIMLSTFLVGIAGGSALASMVIKRKVRPATPNILGWLLAGSAGGAFVSLLVARNLPFLFINLYRSFPERDLTLFVTQFVVSVLLMLPATVCLGAMLPFATSISSASSTAELGRQVSWLYTSNLIGSAAGAVIAAGLLMGNFGIEHSVRAASVFALLVALTLVAASRGTRFSAVGVTMLAGAVLFTLGIDPSGEPVAKGFGFYNDPHAYDQYDTQGLRDLVAAHQLLYYRDGPTATVAVQQVERYLLLKINGKTDASNGPGDTDTQLLLGHLPLMVADADDVAIIGWGSGMTAGAVLSHDVERVDAFEIEPAVIEASRFFEKQNANALDDPRIRMVVGDARSYLLREDQTYDLIVSEPSNPWITGVANLFTQDFFELAASRLKDDGIVSQWFHLYGMTEDSTRCLIATFRTVFPHTLVFKDRDLILLGSRHPIRFDIPRMKRLFEDPDIAKNLSLTHVRYPFDLLAGLRLDEKGAEGFSRGAPLNTDDNLRIELAAPRSLYRDQVEAIRTDMGRYSRSIFDHVTGYGSRAEVYNELAASHLTAGRNDEALEFCRLSLEIEESFEGQKLLGQIYQSMGRIDEARDALIDALELGGDPDARRFVEAMIRSLHATQSR
jgi:spermidine synthase